MDSFTNRVTNVLTEVVPYCKLVTFHKVHTNYHNVLLSQYTTSLLLLKSQTHKYPSLSNVILHGSLTLVLP